MGQFGDGSGQLHADRAIADQHKRQERLAQPGIRFIFCRFKRAQDLTSQREGLLEGFEARSQALPLLMTEVVAGSSRRQDQVIIRDRLCCRQLLPVRLLCFGKHLPEDLQAVLSRARSGFDEHSARQMWINDNVW